MATTNYFRIETETGRMEYVFFNDNLITATESAFAKAAAVSAMKGSIAAWRPPKNPGPWDEYVQLIGHRRRSRIVVDLGSEFPGVVADARRELDSLEGEIKARRSML